MTPFAPTALFDLDGTLTDPYPGISGSILYAIDKLGRPPVDEITLRAAIGPPLEASFAAMLGGDPLLAKEALAHYRDRYAPIGLYENKVFDGIPEMLANLKNVGVQLFVASSKPRLFCERIIEHFGLGSFFVRVHGSEMDGTRSNKADLITHVLESEAIDRSRCVMIGDRRHDIDGARKNGIKVIAVGWGYGSAEEFEETPPDLIVHDVPALVPAVSAELGL
ncbi:phosphoglycolate phosphatase [Kaistia soli DSM 19436]|uniref:Phosphoglycolate phosphatase n=1 Tax=Kaistia soli DSM 19436 TaxID=1122133 RepID=A0A1M5H210_9HYPH|nr:HAD family hydrolase [Kaistia soli]SHG09963.1 phosphoglycolate phosphatase [Kaistia soli DSM 19436]